MDELTILDRRDVETLTHWLGLSDSELLDLIEVSAADAACWCHHETHALAVAPPVLDPLQHLVDRLRYAFPSPDAAHEWLATPHPALGITPRDALRAGDIDRLEQALPS